MIVTAAVICPGQSSRRSPGARESLTSGAATARVMTATGMVGRKIQCQVVWSRITPAINGPTASAVIRDAAQSPTNVARLRGSGTAWLISASVEGSSAAAPSPAHAWPTQMTSTDCADIATAAPTPAIARPARYTFLRPCTSPKTPAVRMRAAMGSWNAEETQVSWDVDACNALWMAGRLAETVVTGR
ncbi:hypothetical protein SALBM311S_00111 [Streptomyces alboniger]